MLIIFFRPLPSGAVIQPGTICLTGTLSGGIALTGTLSGGVGLTGELSGAISLVGIVAHCG